MIGLNYQACVMLILHVNILTLPIILIDLLNNLDNSIFFVIDNFSQFYVSLWDYTTLYEHHFLFMHKWLFNKCQLNFFFFYQCLLGYGGIPLALVIIDWGL